MTYTISNEFLSASIDSFGAELRSVLSAEGTEYLWQRGPHYWADSAPVLFPYIARLYDNGYTYYGERYNMGIHGFAAQSEFRAENVSDDSVTMVLCENQATLKQYPFKFELRITYSLSASTLLVHYSIKNMDSKLMPFAVGGHPGFNVPFDGETDFEDYFLAFDEPCEPVRIGFTDEIFVSGEDSPYPLEDGRIIRLSHRLFDNDAIILANTAKCVTLGSKKTGKALTMGFPGFAYFGIWHMPCTDAPYVCLEPWTSLPSRQGVVEELTEKGDMIILNAGEEYENEWFLSTSQG